MTHWKLSDRAALSLTVVLFVAFILVLEAARADVLTQKRPVMPATAGASTVQTASTTGAFISVPNGYKNTAIRVIADNNSGTSPTLDVTLQDCWEASANSCETLATLPQCTAAPGLCYTNGEYNFQYGDSRKIKPYVRAITTLGGTTPNFDVKVELWQGK